MSFPLEIGGSAPSFGAPADAPAIDLSAPELNPDVPETPAAPDPALVELGNVFGGDFTSFSSVDDANRAALLLSHGLAQAGTAGYANQNAQQYQAPAQQQAQQPATPQSAIRDEDLVDVDPKVVAILRKLEADGAAARAETQSVQQRLTQEQQRIEQQQGQQLLTQVNSVIDSLADPQFGVGGNQTFMQQTARENLLRTADRIASGLRSTGRPLPSVDNLIKMAVFAQTGKMPSGKAAAAAAAKGAPPAPQGGGSGAAGAPGAQARRKTGGEIDTYTADGDFMAGARAILARRPGR